MEPKCVGVMDPSSASNLTSQTNTRMSSRFDLFVTESDFPRADGPDPNLSIGAPVQSDTHFELEDDTIPITIVNADIGLPSSQWGDQFDPFAPFSPSVSPVTSPTHEPTETPLRVDTRSIKFPEPTVPKDPLDMPDVNGVTNWEKLQMAFSDSSRQGSSDGVNSFYSPQGSSSSHTLLTSPPSTSPLQEHRSYSSSDDLNRSNVFTTQTSPIAVQYSSGDESVHLHISTSSEPANSFTSSSFPSGSQSDSGYPLPPHDMLHHHGHHGHTLTVPQLVSPTRGRPLGRGRGLSRHEPYSRSVRSHSVTSVGDLDLGALRLNRSRSPSVVSTASSMNADADISDNEGYYSSQEYYSPRRLGPSPTPDPADYRDTVGSIEIVRASTDRRKHAAMHFCTQRGCGRSFTTKQNLTNHINSHLGIKPHPCDWCEKRFTTAHTRDRHHNTCKRNRTINQQNSQPGPSRA